MPSKTFSRWELWACSRKGHVTFKPTGKGTEDLARKLRMENDLGEAWRCLRCGTFVLGAPKSSGEPTHAPIVLRGKALREAMILRVLAVERFIRGLVAVIAAYGIFRFQTNQAAFQALYSQKLPVLRSIGNQLNYNVDNSAWVHWIEKGLSFSSQALIYAAIFVLLYGMIEIAEAVGLWLMKRWGEYLAAVATSIFIPLEVFELTHHVTAIKIIALLVNVAAVWYLVHAKCLFRPKGKEKYERKLEAVSFLEVQEATKQPVAK